MNYLVIDLEMCNVPKEYQTFYHYSSEIIEIGAVLMDRDYHTIASLRQYVHPEHGVIDHFITDLTGIYSGQVKQAPKLEEALRHLIEWIGDREYIVMAWSGSDWNQLSRELRSKQIRSEIIDDFINPERWTDYQAVFSDRFEFAKAMSLEEALALCEIEANGRLHDGMDDAVNTAHLIEKLENAPDYQIPDRTRYDNLEKEPLNFSLGSLFANLDLEF